MDQDPLQVLSGSPSATELLFEKCYKHWFPRLTSYLIPFHLGKTRTEDREEAKDIAQETMLWASQEPAKRCTPAYLRCYARSRAIDKIRKRCREVPLQTPTQDGDDGPQQYGDPTVETEESAIRRLDLRECIKQLPDEERVVTELTLLGLTAEEIEEITGIPAGTVGRKLSDAKNKLTVCMTGKERQRRGYEPRTQTTVAVPEGGEK